MSEIARHVLRRGAKALAVIVDLIMVEFFSAAAILIANDRKLGVYVTVNCFGDIRCLFFWQMTIICPFPIHLSMTLDEGTSIKINETCLGDSWGLQTNRFASVW
jgi:hypothetical protein